MLSLGQTMLPPSPQDGAGRPLGSLYFYSRAAVYLTPPTLLLALWSPPRRPYAEGEHYC
jgi:hypothetical protein